MYSEFAHSGEMQCLLGVTTLITTFVSMYLVAGIILTFCGEKASRAQKSLFALITGTLMQTVWVYSVYFIGGMVSFDRLQYAMITSPNPVFALVYYAVAIRVFKLSRVRSVKMMGYMYFYWIFNKTLNRLLGSIFFVQGARYNYLLDALQQVTMLLVFFTITTLAKHCIIRYHAHMKFIDSGFFNKKRELLCYFLKALFVYSITVAMPLIVPSQVFASLLLNLLLWLFIFINALYDLHTYDRQEISNQMVHISALFKGLEEFRGIKHDFYNILHTYSGYLELGEYDKLKTYHATLVQTTTHAGTILDLARRAPENPALISLLMDKLEHAERHSLKMIVSIQCGIEDFFINPLDFTRVMSCLLDNAIEAAAETRDQRIHVTCEEKPTGSKLVIITNSTDGPVDVDAIQAQGVTSKPGHSGIGLSTVRGTLNKYGNCTFQMKHFNNELSAYVELERP